MINHLADRYEYLRDRQRFLLSVRDQHRAAGREVMVTETEESIASLQRQGAAISDFIATLEREP